MKNFLIAFALVTVATVIAACEQKAVEPATDAAAKTPDAAVAAPDAGAPQLEIVQPAEAPVAESGPATVGPAVVTVPVVEPAAGPVAEPAK